MSLERHLRVSKGGLCFPVPGGAGKNETSLFFSILWQIFDTISQCTSSMCSGRNEKCNEKMQFRNCHYAAFASALREKTNV